MTLINTILPAASRFLCAVAERSRDGPLHCADELTCASPERFRLLTRDRPEHHQASRNGAGVRERSHSHRSELMTSYQKTLVAAFGGITAGLATAVGSAALMTGVAMASSTCTQVPGLGPFAGSTCFQDEFAPLMRNGLSSGNAE